MIPTRVMPTHCMWSPVILSTILFINPILQNEETELQGNMQLAQGHMATKRMSKVCALNLCALLGPRRKEQCGVSLSRISETWPLMVHLAGCHDQNLLGLLFPKQKWWRPRDSGTSKIFSCCLLIWNLAFLSWDLCSPVYLQMNKTGGITVSGVELQKGLKHSTCFIPVFLFITDRSPLGPQIDLPHTHFRSAPAPAPMFCLKKSFLSFKAQLKCHLHYEVLPGPTGRIRWSSSVLPVELSASTAKIGLTTLFYLVVSVRSLRSENCLSHKSFYPALPSLAHAIFHQF